MGVKIGKPWPTFRPVDQNVTCKRCGEAWVDHGTSHGHCPPCRKADPRDKPGVRTHNTQCQKTINHKGPCRHA